MQGTPAEASAASARTPILVEVLGAYALATGAAALLYRVRALDDWFHVLVAALFLYLPAWVLRRRDLDEYGLTPRPLGKNLALVGRAVLLVFPPFLAGYLLLEAAACAAPLLRPLAPTACEPGALLSHLHLHFAPALLSPDPRRNLLLAEIVVVALPEEFFFRGFVQGRLAEAWPKARTFLGAEVGPALVAASALFALSHVAVQGNPATLAVFFPGLLFGWMRARTGSILPGTLFHALCNVYIDTLSRSLHGLQGLQG